MVEVFTWVGNSNMDDTTVIQVMMHEQQTLKLQIKTSHQSVVQHDQLVRMTEALISAVQQVPVIYKKVNYVWEFDTLTSSEMGWSGLGRVAMPDSDSLSACN